jgi:hypothetical protein
MGLLFKQEMLSENSSLNVLVSHTVPILLNRNIGPFVAVNDTANEAMCIAMLFSQSTCVVVKLSPQNKQYVSNTDSKATLDSYVVYVTFGTHTFCARGPKQKAHGA